MFPINRRWQSALAPPEFTRRERRNHFWRCATVVAAMLSCQVGLAENPRIYVDASAAAGGDGTSWEMALRDLQDAIAIAEARECVDTVWVAQGTYKPDRGTNNSTLSFYVTSELNVYGRVSG